METYQFVEVAAEPSAPLLFLLHGTGGSEHDLIDLGRQLMPDARLISPRGDVSENGALRFFKRAGMGVYDMDDLARATVKMAAFMREQIAGLRPAAVAALGFSNGANMLASLLFEAPEILDRAVLMHPLIPFQPAAQRRLGGKPVLITAGRRDPIAPPAATEALVAYFEAQQARVETCWHDGGHDLRPVEVAAARDFLGRQLPAGGEG